MREQLQNEQATYMVEKGVRLSLLRESKLQDKVSMQRHAKETEDLELERKLQKKRSQLQFSKIYAEQVNSRKLKELLSATKLTAIERRGFDLSGTSPRLL